MDMYSSEAPNAEHRALVPEPAPGGRPAPSTLPVGGEFRRAPASQTVQAPCCRITEEKSRMR